MTAIEQAFHEKWIKGISLKMIWGFISLFITLLIAIASMAYALGKYVTKLEITIKDGNTENRQFTKDQVSGLRTVVFAKFDTIKINQMQSDFNTKLEINKRRLQHTAVAISSTYTSAYRDPAGHYHFYPVKKP